MGFDYHLPKEKIAQSPAIPRDSCKLLVLNGERIEHRKFSEIIHYVKEGDAIVLNNSKVMKVRLFGRKETGGKIEILIVGKRENEYEALIKGKIREGTKFYINEYEGEVVRRENGKCIIQLPLEMEEIEKIGNMPTPPYIKREVEKDEWYQTVYAKHAGSIAAPTAGLHFTEELLEKIKRKGVQIVFVTLHVGLATFLPPERMKNEREYYHISEEAAEIINSANNVIAVGTTTVKALESSSKNGRVVASSGWSNLFIEPGYKFQSPIRGMLTNFHMPNSSPLLLTSAFAGKERIMKAYEEALKMDYRFLSFGDAMLILKQY